LTIDVLEWTGNFFVFVVFSFNLFSRYNLTLTQPETNCVSHCHDMIIPVQGGILGRGKPGISPVTYWSTIFPSSALHRKEERESAATGLTVLKYRALFQFSAC
jgi:hypothetical protein